MTERASRRQCPLLCRCRLLKTRCAAQTETRLKEDGMFGRRIHWILCFGRTMIVSWRPICCWRDELASGNQIRDVGPPKVSSVSIMPRPRNYILRGTHSGFVNSFFWRHLLSVNHYLRCSITDRTYGTQCTSDLRRPQTKRGSKAEARDPDTLISSELLSRSL